MATYPILRQGSTGNDVLKMQTSLKNAGYDVGPLDGIYGGKTAAAVTKYQTDNKLTIDGIAGNQTLGSLYTPKLPTTPTGNTADPSKWTNDYLAIATPDELAKYDAWKSSQSTGTVDSGVGDKLPVVGSTDSGGGTPKVPDSPYSDSVMNTLSTLSNSSSNPWAYDVTSDPMYAPLKQQYESAGMTAFNNTIGRLAALTGGRPSTAAVGTAQGGYNDYIQQFSASVLPTLANQAYGRYQDQISNQSNLLKTQMGIEDTGYDRAQTAAKDEKQTFIDTMGQYYDDIQKQINTIANDGDTSNDWQLGYLKTYRQEKIKALETAKAASQSAETQAEYDRAYDMWKASGTATAYMASVLGVPVGAKTAEYNIDAQNATTSRMNAETAKTNAAKTSADKTDTYTLDDWNKILESEFMPKYNSYGEKILDGITDLAERRKRILGLTLPDDNMTDQILIRWGLPTN